MFVVFGGILPTLTLGTLTSGETWAVIGLILVFLAWFLMFLGVRLKGF
ncbi:MAG: hypothetical protein ACW986_15055 [Promethearchaeota archaeon]|jgi:hypothetical protein